ncbi:MAG: CFI-box-CTERM domain-containing protein [bacterium]|nr:CFI-box-CTERM domain-containing protein [bacterium]
MFCRLIIILLLIANLSFASSGSLVTLEIDAQHLDSAKIPKALCRQSELLQKFKKTAPKSWQKAAKMNSLLATQNAVAVLNSTQNFRVDEGARTISFVLRYQRQISVANSNLLINVWVDEQKYYDQDQDNNLNSQAFGVGNQPTRVTDRDNTIQEIGTILSEVIVPESIAAFGSVNPVANSLSEGFNVLIYDISDNFQFTGSFIGGYFDPDDKFNPNNNRMNAIHMDMYPSNPGGNSTPIGAFIPALPRKDFYQVLAHEFQHLIHAQFDLGETIWVNEGFSQYAIYRTLFNKTFSNGEPLLIAPTGSPSQVPFWLADPSSSQLISSDELGIQGKVFQRYDSAELRGIGYLFFTYLWEQLGGSVSNGSLVGSEADSRINSMIKSSANGISSIQAGLEGSSYNFNDIFNAFTVALNADGINSLYNMEFFDFSNGTQLNISTSLNVSQNLLPVTFSLAGYDFRVIRVNGGSQAASLSLTSTTNFHAYLLEGSGPQSRSLQQDLAGLENPLFIAANSSNVLILSNPSLGQISVQLSYLNSLSLASQPITSVQFNDADFVNGQPIDPLSVNGNQIVRQSFNNNTSIDLDILNDRPREIAISACISGQNCINASHLIVPGTTIVRKAAVKVGNQDYFYSNLKLDAGTTYDLYYANKTNSSLQVSPLVTKTAVVISNSAQPPVVNPEIPISSGSAAGGGGGCFLASASFMGKNSYEVRALSLFRDEFLLKSHLGKSFVTLYYRYSPKIAEYISSRPLLGLLGQFLLMPLIISVGIIYQFHWILILLLILPFVLPRNSRN